MKSNSNNTNNCTFMLIYNLWKYPNCWNCILMYHMTVLKHKKHIITPGNFIAFSADRETTTLSRKWLQRKEAETTMVKTRWLVSWWNQIFYIGLWLGMGNGYSTTTSKRIYIMLCTVHRCHQTQYQHQKFMVKWSWSESGRTKSILYTMSY